MAKQTINLGTSANKGDGDPLRTAFDKVNDNFDEVYSLLGAEGGDTDDVVAPMLVHSDHTNVTVTRDDDANKIIFSVDQAVTDLQGSVFGDDSTLLVDGVNSKINLDGTVKGDIIPDTDVTYDLGSASKRFRDLYLSGSTIDLGGTTLSIVGGELQLGGVKVPTQTDLDTAISTPTGDLTGSVFADDSTLLVDGVNGVITGDIENGRVITGIVRSETDENLFVYAGGTGSVILAGQSNVSIGHTSGQVDIYGAVEFNNGTTAFQSGNNVDFNCNLNFTDATITGFNTNSITTPSGNLSLTADSYVIIDSDNNGQINIGQSSGVGNVLIGNRSNGTDISFNGNVNGLVYTKEESTGGSSTGTPTTISLTAVKNLYVLDSADTDDDSWLLPDGVEGQVIHLVPGPGTATNQHYVQITNWRKWDEGAGDAGEWRVRTGLDWMPFKLDNTPLYRSLATAVFVNGAWQTDTPWID